MAVGVCCACRKNPENKNVLVAGHNICDECFGKYTDLRNEDRQLAMDWIKEKLGGRKCHQRNKVRS